MNPSIGRVRNLFSSASGMYKYMNSLARACKENDGVRFYINREGMTSVPVINPVGGEGVYRTIVVEGKIAKCLYRAGIDRMITHQKNGPIPMSTLFAAMTKPVTPAILARLEDHATIVWNSNDLYSSLLAVNSEVMSPDDVRMMILSPFALVRKIALTRIGDGLTVSDIRNMLHSKFTDLKCAAFDHPLMTTDMLLERAKTDSVARGEIRFRVDNDPGSIGETQARAVAQFPECHEGLAAATATPMDVLVGIMPSLNKEKADETVKRLAARTKSPVMMAAFSSAVFPSYVKAGPAKFREYLDIFLPLYPDQVRDDLIKLLQVRASVALGKIIVEALRTRFQPTTEISEAITAFCEKDGWNTRTIYGI